MKKLMLLSLLIFGGNQLWAQDFTYTPKNPAFGGYYYNYSWLMSSAQAQNNTEDPEKISSTTSTRNELEDFEASLNRQILSQLSRQIVRSQFGEDALSEGSYNIGSYQLEVSEGLDGLNVIILDASTGNQTTINIPYY